MEQDFRYRLKEAVSQTCFLIFVLCFLSLHLFFNFWLHVNDKNLQFPAHIYRKITFCQSNRLRLKENGYVFDGFRFYLRQLVYCHPQKKRKIPSFGTLGPSGRWTMPWVYKLSIKKKQIISYFSLEMVSLRTSSAFLPHEEFVVMFACWPLSRCDSVGQLSCLQLDCLSHWGTDMPQNGDSQLVGRDPKVVVDLIFVVCAWPK